MLTVTLFCLACALYWIWKHRPTDSSEPRDYPGGLDFKFQLSALLGLGIWNTVNILARQSYLLGGVMTTRIGLRTVYVVTDPNLFYTVTDSCVTRHDSIFSKFWEFKSKYFKTSYKWNYHSFYPLLESSYLNSFMKVFNSQSRKLVEDLEQELEAQSFDHVNYMKLYVMETNIITNVGEDSMHLIPDSSGSRIYNNTLMDKLMKYWLLPTDLRNRALKRKLNTYLNKLNSLTLTVRVIGNWKTGRTFKPLLSLLMELKEKIMLKDKETMVHLQRMIVHGSDSVTAALVFTTVLLGSYPDVQDKILVEFEEILGHEDTDVDADALDKLEYLEAVIKESVRLYSVVPVVTRKLDKDVKLENYTLSAGRCCCFIDNINHQPLIWGLSVRDFRPERWLEPAKLSASAKACAFSGVGGRMCLGKAYTLKLMKTTLVHVLRRYQIRADHTQMTFHLQTTLQPSAGHHVSIRRRS